MYRIIVCLFLLTSLVLAQNSIEVIYPKNGQQISVVDSTFIFGNINPKAKLTINGFNIPVHKDGGFLAFLPVKPGAFRFELISDYQGSIATDSLEIFVGDSSLSSENYIDTTSLSPSERTVLIQNQVLPFSVRAKASGTLRCRFADDTAWTTMYPQPDNDDLNSVFGDMTRSGSNYQTAQFTGYLSLADIKDSSRVFYTYNQDIYDSTGAYLCSEYESDNTDYYIVKYADLPPRSVKLTGRPHIVRIIPDGGYKLVNQPEGVRFRYAGETPDYYCVKLTESSSGYIKKSDAILEPETAPLPQGIVSFIQVDNYDDYVELSLEIGDNLPYEIHTDGSTMTVDIFYLTSDTDWIRFNGDSQKYIKSLWWSQPQDNLYRLNINWYDNHFWGYDPYYNGDTLKLKLNKCPDKPGWFCSPVKGLKIVLDPGHSPDSGAVGPTGLLEKDVNFKIAEQLQRILTGKGAKVIMTRQDDEGIGLYNRVDIADSIDADLLISIHNNALPDGINPFTHNGASVYYYFDQARPLAEAIHKHLLNNTKLPDHGLYYGNLALCRFAECPAVLVECAFMMIPEQEAMLKTEKFQRKCAKAIYQGICDYLKGK